MSCVNAKNLLAMFPCHIPTLPVIPSLYRFDSTASDPRSAAALLQVVNNVRYPIARLPEVQQQVVRHQGPPTSKPLTSFSISDILQRTETPPPPPASRVQLSRDGGSGHKRRRHEDVTAVIGRRISAELNAKVQMTSSSSIRRPWDDDGTSGNDRSLSDYTSAGDTDAEVDDDEYDDHENDRLTLKNMELDERHDDEEDIDVDDCSLTQHRPLMLQRRQSATSRQKSNDESPTAARHAHKNNVGSSSAGSRVVCPLDALLRMASKPFDTGNTSSGQYQLNIMLMMIIYL